MLSVFTFFCAFSYSGAAAGALFAFLSLSLRNRIDDDVT